MLPELDFENPDLSAWADRLGEDVAALFVPMVTSLSGLLYPIKAIGAIPRPANTKYIVDGAQAVGQMRVDVQAIGCDAFIATGRKWLRGPRQTAMVWIKDGWIFQGREICGRDLEAFDQNLILRLGLGVAVDHVLDVGIDTIERDILLRSSQIRTYADEQGLRLAGGLTGNASINIPSAQIEQVSAIIENCGVMAKLPNAATFEPLSCKNGFDSVVLRFSPHVYTTDSDVEAVFGVMHQIAKLNFKQ